MRTLYFKQGTYNVRSLLGLLVELIIVILIDITVINGISNGKQTLACVIMPAVLAVHMIRVNPSFCVYVEKDPQYNVLKYSRITATKKENSISIVIAVCCSLVINLLLGSIASSLDNDIFFFLARLTAFYVPLFLHQGISKAFVAEYLKKKGVTINE